MENILDGQLRPTITFWGTLSDKPRHLNITLGLEMKDAIPSIGVTFGRAFLCADCLHFGLLAAAHEYPAGLF